MVQPLAPLPPPGTPNPDTTNPDTAAARAAEIKEIAETAAIAAVKAAREANKARADCEGSMEEPTPILADLPRHLEAGAGSYNELVAFALSAASAWAYAEEQDIPGRMMSYLGFDDARGHQTYAWTVHNGPLLVETTAFFFQAGKVGILCFRGTEPTNAMAWLSNMSFEMTRFSSWGQVHSGFYNGLQPLWPTIRGVLNQAVLGPSPLSMQVAPFAGYVEGSTSSVKGASPGMSPMEVLYLCGHSLGGAHAVLAAAKIHQDPQCACIRETLRGVYTFGQPLVGDQEFSNACNRVFGDHLFRHIYEHDIVPRYPPKLFGAFRTPGQDYLSTSEGWLHQSALPVRQASTLITSTILGAIAFVLEQIPVLREIRLPYSWSDHRPINYVRCSRLSVPFYR